MQSNHPVEYYAAIKKEWHPKANYKVDKPPKHHAE